MIALHDEEDKGEISCCGLGWKASLRTNLCSPCFAWRTGTRLGNSRHVLTNNEGCAARSCLAGGSNEGRSRRLTVMLCREYHPYRMHKDSESRLQEDRLQNCSTNSEYCSICQRCSSSELYGDSYFSCRGPKVPQKKFLRNNERDTCETKPSTNPTF